MPINRETTPETDHAYVCEVVEAWMRDKAIDGIDHGCHVCGTRDWDIDEMFELPSFVPTNTIVYPVVPLTCVNCGNAILLNAVAIGLLPRSEDQTS